MNPSTPKIAEVRISKLSVNIIATLLSFLLCIMGAILAHLLPHYHAFAGWHATAALLYFIVIIPIHELLHALGLSIFAQVPWSQVKFGFLWHALVPYCHCKVPIPIVAYRRMALLPLWITGGATLAALLIYPTHILGLLAGLTLATCVGDVWLVLKAKRFADDVLVQDSPSEVGFDVISSIPAELSQPIS